MTWVHVVSGVVVFLSLVAVMLTLRRAEQQEVEMLVLSRKEGEAIQLSGGIRVVVLSIGGGRTRLGIEAPRSVSVHREEIVNQSGSNLDPGDMPDGGAHAVNPK